MKLRGIFLLALLLGVSPALAQVNPGTTPLSIPKGGTGGGTAAAARASLGLAIGTNVEAWNTNLDCLAALVSTGFIQRTGSGTCAVLAAIPFASTTFTQSGTGAVPVSLDSSYRNIIINPEQFGDNVRCSAASGAGIQSAINFIGTVVGTGTVQVANCMYPTSGPTTDPYPGVEIAGYASATGSSSGITFTPTAQNQCALSLGAGASILSNVAVRNIKITTADTTTYKKGLCVSDGSVITLDNVYVTNFFGGFATIVTGAANSGTGEIRLTVANASVNYNNGYAVMVGGVAGTVEANQSWPIIVSGATAIDLKGSHFSNAFANSHAAFTGTIVGSTLTTTGTTGTINPGAIIGGSGISGNILILSQTSGTVGGNGVYALSASASATAVSMTSDAVIIVSSTGIQLSGRELYQINNVSSVADLPLRISPNPNVAGGIEALDESNFNNLSLGGATGTNSIVMVDTGVVLSSVKFGGTQSWGGGKNGFSWNDNTATGISEQVSFDHVRAEQKAIAGGTLFNIQPNQTLYSLSIRDPEFADRNGVLARNVGNLQIDTPHWLSSSGVCLDIDATVVNTHIDGGYWLGGSSTANLVGQFATSPNVKNPTSGCLPPTGDYANAAPTGNKAPYLKTASATFTTDATSSTLTTYTGYLTGSGGGGGGSNATLAAASGAGGGGTCQFSFTGVAPSTTVTVTLGTGGTAGSSAGGNGGAGGSSTIAATGITTITATGGTGANGTTTTVSSPGSGGTCTTGTSVASISGGTGSLGLSPPSGNGTSGAGGGSWWGPGGANANPSLSASGGAGVAPGAGGGGGAGATTPGGAGANGAAVVQWVSMQ